MGTLQSAFIRPVDAQEININGAEITDIKNDTFYKLNREQATDRSPLLPPSPPGERSRFHALVRDTKLESILSNRHDISGGVSGDVLL